MQMEAQDSTAADFVAILRDFLDAHRALRRVGERYAAGVLAFSEVEALVGDGEGAVLFRLKERCHALFRTAGSPTAMRREVLFDLAVGALFHESMKFRENFYQHAVYGPKVRELGAVSDPGETDLFREFEKILSESEARTSEALDEALTLLAQTTAELRSMLAAHPEYALVTRFLVEREALVGEVLRSDLAGLLAAIHGSAGEGFATAARSYLESGYYGEAAAAFRRALECDPGREDAPTLQLYAEGMQDFLEGRYADAVGHITGWLETDPGRPDHVHAAFNAISKVGQLAPAGPEHDALRSAAADLAEALARAQAAR